MTDAHTAAPQDSPLGGLLVDGFEAGFEEDFFKTRPYQHQLHGFYLQRDKRYFGLVMDMGTGKTKLTLDTAAWMFYKQRINAIMVVAPNNVHSQWVRQQVGEHLPMWVPRLSAAWYSSPRAAQRKRWEAVMAAPPTVLQVTAWNYEALATKRAQAEFTRLLRTRKVMLVLDESHRIKTPRAVVSRYLRRVAEYAVVRRILSGTPLLNDPTDVYAQMQFLSRSILNVKQFAAFKARYCRQERHCQRCHREALAADQMVCSYCGHKRFYETVAGYRNIGELRERCAPYLYRVRKADCLDLPPKVYEQVTLQPTPEQARLYDEMLQDGVALLSQSAAQPLPGEAADEYLWRLLTDKDIPRAVASNALTKIVRAQQVAGGFLLSEDGSYIWLAEPNRKLSTLLDIMEDVQGKVIVWATFHQELALIAQGMEKAGYSTVQYHGLVPPQEREEALAQFADPNGPRVFLGTPAAGGTGLNLQNAGTVIYYSNSVNAGHRWQSEDRAHRIGQQGTVVYWDLFVEGTLDERIRKSHGQKLAMAGYLLGDNDDAPSMDRVTMFD